MRLSFDIRSCDRRSGPAPLIQPRRPRRAVGGGGVGRLGLVLLAVSGVLGAGGSLPERRAAAALGKTAVPLRTFSPEQVRSLAPLLRQSDITLLESEPSGRLKQVSLFTLVAAPPHVVRAVLLDAAKYTEFVRNFVASKVTPRTGGSFEHSYQLSYRVYTIDGTHLYVPQPADPQAGAPPVEVMDQDDPPGTARHYRWEFHSVAGATVLAVYGYTDMFHSGGVIDSLIKRVPQLEHGLALVSQGALVLAMKRQAEQMYGSPPLMPAAGTAGYDFLLERGLVGFLRNSADGRLSEVSLVDRSSARPDVLLDNIKRMNAWSTFIPTITKSADSPPREGIPMMVDLVQSLPLVSFHTLFGARTTNSSVDMYGVEGDLRGARMRWDVMPGRGAESQVVLRSSQQFDRASLIIRQLYKLEPLFEYGINVGLQLVFLRGVKMRAEQQSAAPPQGAG